MSEQIIKQPNGKFCIFSSNIDNVTIYNATESEIINEFVKVAKIQITQDVKNIIKSLENGKKPYHQFTMSIDDVYEMVEILHGKKEAVELKKLTESTD